MLKINFVFHQSSKLFKIVELFITLVSTSKFLADVGNYDSCWFIGCSFCLSNDLILFTRYKTNVKSTHLQCSIICAQDFHISIRAPPKVFTLPFFWHDSNLLASAIKINDNNLLFRSVFEFWFLYLFHSN